MPEAAVHLSSEASASARIFIFFFLFRCVQDVGRAVGMFLFYNTTAAKQFQNKWEIKKDFLCSC